MPNILLGSMAEILLQHVERVHSVSTRRSASGFPKKTARTTLPPERNGQRGVSDPLRQAGARSGRLTFSLHSPDAEGLARYEALAPADFGPEGTDNCSFRDERSCVPSRVFLQVLELNGHGSIRFQEFQELKVHPFQAILLGQQAENDDDADNLAV